MIVIVISKSDSNGDSNSDSNSNPGMRRGGESRMCTADGA